MSHLLTKLQRVNGHFEAPTKLERGFIETAAKVYNEDLNCLSDDLKFDLVAPAPSGGASGNTSIDAIFEVIGQLIRQIDFYEEKAVQDLAHRTQNRQRFDRALGDCTKSSQGIQAFRLIGNIVLGIKLAFKHNPATRRETTATANGVADFIVGLCEDVERMFSDIHRDGQSDFAIMLERKLQTYDIGVEMR